MYIMLRANGWLSTISHEVPAGLAALAFAEVFYKFHSFTLECLAFLATWYVFSWIESLASALFRNRKKGVSHD